MELDSNLPVDNDNDDNNNSDKNGSNVGERNRTGEVSERIGEDDVSEDEDDDFDFNPLLKENFEEEELSSSLSSEIDGVENNAVIVESVNFTRNDNDYDNDNDNDNDNDVLVSSSNVVVEQLSSDQYDLGCLENGIRVCDGDRERNSCDENGGGIDVVVDLPEKTPFVDLDNVNNSNNDDDEEEEEDEDAICRRTRARYSLASFTLDELETFLQETDDDDDIQNVDEEEEYRKFLAAVLRGGDGDEGNMGGNDNDDDEDNDADFEVEIEEALESDVDDCVVSLKDNGEFVRSSRRPETRQNRGKNPDVQNKNKIKGKETTQLRPLLPIMPMTIDTSTPFHGGFQFHQVKGFMAHQIGQLYSLIYEHVQLLIQIYSLCVLEPSRQHIASQLKGLLSELVHKRDLVLAWRNRAYPSSCFVTPYFHSTGSNEPSSCPSAQGSGSQGSRWLPSVGGPVLSVLDVAPLKLVGKYFEDVSNAVREHQRRCVETTDIYMERQPLFPLPISPTSLESNKIVSQGEVPTPQETTSVSPNMKVPKKTLAATLVESTKKQSVALVSRQIARVAQPFYSLFNPALFPHKPPSYAVANRVLFTDSEDELLAMGIMEYNNDWKAIKQRFLPCKSEHQIFIRAKNRCSSKAPENPIKAVRKMKTSPLTDEEKARIHEGLKTFKLDWMAVWKFIVPYRDPNLLGRQWRIANGTQKSYKANAVKKERRRMYESNRRKFKATAVKNSLNESDKEDDHTENSGNRNGSGDDCVENDNEAYLHEAFLADWRPNSSRIQPSQTLETQKSQSEKGHIHEVATASESSYLMQSNSFQPYTSHSGAPCKSTHVCSYKSQKRGAPNLVKLAPELPPVKLPSAVRVIPQSLLSTSQIVPSRAVKTVKSIPATVKTVNYSASNGNGHRTEGARIDSDPQMHPLLFQTLEEGRLPYYPSSSRVPTFSFFPVQTQMNVTVQNPSHAGPIGARSKSSNLDFHPLLQRSSDSDPLLLTDLELSRSKSARSTDPVDLNLDIHTSSSLRKRKVPSYDGTGADLTGLSVSATESAQGEEGRMVSACMVPNMSDGSVACTNDDVGEELLVGIVMEQEELSDSDEELESVEFECEEMTDSDEEGSDNERNVDAQNENQKKTDIATSNDGTSNDIHAGKQKQTPSSASVNPGEDNALSPWLSLNLRGSQQSVVVTSKNDPSTEGLSTQSRPSRSSQKGTMSTISTPGELVTDVSQPGPSRKSPKQTSKITHSLP